MNGRSAATLRTAVRDPFGVEREAVLLRLDDDAGNIGWGEASPLEGYSPDDIDGASRALDAWVVRWTAGEFDGDGFERSLDLALAESDLRGVPSVRCAIDTAVLDLEARRLGVPLHAVLADLLKSTRVVQRVPVCALVTLHGVDRPGTPAAPADALSEVRRLVAEGFSDVKFKIGAGPEFSLQLDQLRAVRAEFPQLRIRLDANGSWMPDEAHQRLGELKAAIDPELVEQPVGALDLLTFVDAPVPVAADESLRLSDAIPAVTQPGGCEAVVLKPMVLGGHLACLSLARQAHANGARAIVSHTFGGRIAHAAACELALAVAVADPGGDPPAAGLAGHDELEQRDGPWIVPTDLAGHGVEKPW